MDDLTSNNDNNMMPSKVLFDLTLTGSFNKPCICRRAFWKLARAAASRVVVYRASHHQGRPGPPR